jgi:nucleoside-diphosphate-sugar epimerase
MDSRSTAPDSAANPTSNVLPRVVAVTGCSGLLGQRLLPLLDSIDSVERIIGLDVREPARRVPTLEFHLVDLADADLVPLLEGVDTVVHLAAIVGPATDPDLARTVNVGATRSVLVAAGSSGIRKIVRASSAAIYGAWANNDVPLDEDRPLRPNPGYEPAILDAECERLLNGWREEHEDRVVTCLRIAPIVGGGARSIFARAAAGRPPAVVRGAAPPFQVVHVDDAAQALAIAVASDLDGPFNVAADGWLDHDAALAVAPHRRPPGVPEEVAIKALSAMWGSGLGDAPPEVLPYVMHPWVVANDRLRAHGWAPRHTNEEAILLAGDPDARRRPLPWVAAVSAVLAGAAGATWWLRRRR